MLWKILRFPLTRIIVSILAVVAAQVGVVSSLRPFHWQQQLLGTGAAEMLRSILLILAGYLAYWAYVHLIERRRAGEIKPAVPQFGAGVLVGAALFSATVGLLWAAGLYHVSGSNGWAVLSAACAGSLGSGFVEELYLRGIFFRVLEEWAGSWISLGSSALLFGLLHLGNPHATLTSALAIALEAGIMLAAAFMLTRNLWFPAGIHFAWNFTQGGIFGIAVSGNRAQGVLRSQLTGPELLSGGSFGAEASVFAVVVCVIAGVWILMLAIRKGHVVPVFWHRRPVPENVTADIQW